MTLELDYARYDNNGNPVPYTIEECEQYKKVLDNGMIGIMIYDTKTGNFLNGAREDGVHDVCLKMGPRGGITKEELNITFDEMEGIYHLA